jgi:uncharacterized protein YcbK (DUF882 family)
MSAGGNTARCAYVFPVMQTSTWSRVLGSAVFVLAALLAVVPSGVSASSGTLALTGFSGKLRAIFALPNEAPSVSVSTGGTALLVMTPFSSKVRGRIGSYEMGTWPYEQGGRPKTSSYVPPRGFLQVTPQNSAEKVSEHFALGDFLTKDQLSIWPKYEVLDPRLLDKLELTIDELAAEGHPLHGLHVMSGFRTPRYNAPGVGEGGRSAISRHMYGDAADVYPDDARLEDLNGDGKVDIQDARILARAAELVEKKYPALIGGIGIYPATSAHPPFVHIDARGYKARWGAWA